MVQVGDVSTPPTLTACVRCGAAPDDRDPLGSVAVYRGRVESTGRRFVVRWTSADEVALRCEGAEAVVLSRPLLHREFVVEVGHE